MSLKCICFDCQTVEYRQISFTCRDGNFRCKTCSNRRRNRKYNKTQKAQDAKKRQHEKYPEQWKARMMIVNTRRRMKNGDKIIKSADLVMILNSLPDYCIKCNTKKNLSVDHIIPLVLGGDPYSKDNLTTLCLACNGRKGATDES